MKNPENKPLRIVYTHNDKAARLQQEYCVVLSNLAIAESNLVRGGKESAMPHFIAIVKELEKVYGFEFRTIDTALPQTD
jgi:hypothetical protein